MHRLSILQHAAAYSVPTKTHVVIGGRHQRIANRIMTKFDALPAYELLVLTDDSAIHPKRVAVLAGIHVSGNVCTGHDGPQATSLYSAYPCITQEGAQVLFNSHVS